VGYTSMAQFYYKDIISNKQLLQDVAVYKQRNIKQINISSFEDDGSPSVGFFCQKKISKNYSQITLFTRSNISGTSQLSSFFNEKGLLAKTYDSSVISVTSTIYAYDNADRILSISSTIHSKDDDFSNEIQEEHIYQYNAAGNPEKMIRIKNKSDSTPILFASDEKNNVTIEKDTRSGTKYYYYYDEKNRITDVVQENDFKKSMLPDYIFEYDRSTGNLAQMTTTEEGINDYYIWKYSYDNGLRVKERCFNKQKRLMGSIQYEYK
jgi:hypothetical protein